MFIDSHTHLDLTLKQTSFNISELLPDSLDFVLQISLNPFDFIENQPLFSGCKNIYYATGIYPDNTTRADFNEKIWLNKLRETLLSFPHVALGEAGIDFKYEKYGSREAQESLFRGQLALAEELHLPIIVHSRETFEECFEILKEFPKIKVLIHCFSYGPQEAEKLLESGYYLSFSGNLTFKNAATIREAAMLCPPDRIFFETDCPYLTPEPFRGTPNIPANVALVYRKFAEMHGLELSDLTQQIRQNAETFFGIKAK